MGAGSGPRPGSGPEMTGRMSGRVSGPVSAGLWQWERETPFLLLDPQVAVRAYGRIAAALPFATVHYAVKAQPDRGLLAALAGAGACFEVASAAETAALVRLGVPGSALICSNPVKSITDIALMRKMGVHTFAFDSGAEIIKLAAAAPGCEVVVRLRTAAGSEVGSEGKFGVSAPAAAALLLAAQEAGLDPVGIGWHVGSQCVDPAAWIAPIDDAAHIMKAVAKHGVTISLLNLGGGFPATYDGLAPPDISTYGKVIGDALEAWEKKAPGLFPVSRIVAEPGRAVVAEAGVMVASVIGTARRGGRRWAHLDVGAFHGLMEALETGCGIAWPVTDSRGDRARRRWTLTDPSCDSQGTIARGVELSADLSPGVWDRKSGTWETPPDRVRISCTGAYSTAYSMGAFNGFVGPDVVLGPLNGGVGDA